MKQQNTVRWRIKESKPWLLVFEGIENCLYRDTPLRELWETTGLCEAEIKSITSRKPRTFLVCSSWRFWSSFCQSKPQLHSLVEASPITMHLITKKNWFYLLPEAKPCPLLNLSKWHELSGLPHPSPGLLKEQGHQRTLPTSVANPKKLKIFHMQPKMKIKIHTNYTSTKGEKTSASLQPTDIKLY